jgi:hypothetical protein
MEEDRKASVSQDRVRPLPGSIPVIADSKVRLVLRRQFEDMFRSLDLIHDEIEVASEAARSEGQPEIANVLTYCVGSRLFGELKSLTNIIEWLGGRTNLSEVQEPTNETAQQGDTTHAK